MAISFTKYVNITSGVGAGATVATRDLIGRLFTNNLLVPSGSMIEFSSLGEVGDYFGTDSEEYERATFYFGWISKNITRAQKISFARWVDAAQAPMIFGARFTATLLQLKSITTGAFSLTLGGVTNLISGLNFSGAADFAAIAALIETEINGETGLQWTGATVSYNATRGSFDFVGGSAVAANIIVAAPGSGTNIVESIGWGVGAILSDGAAVESITNTLTASTDASNNFGSFLFMPVLALDEIVEAATWNNAQNVLFQYCVPVALADETADAEALADIGGVSLTSSVTAGEYPEQVPMMILAATDYTQPNSVQNYMFQQFALTPSVTTDARSDALDALRINYYGETQTAGQLLSFYQRGLLMGLATDPRDMNTYANEQWLKDAAGSAIMTLLIALAELSANTGGRGQLLTILQSVIAQAVANGTISVGKTLSTTQKLYITEITNDPAAWQQVQTIGYWVNCTMNPTLNEADYLLVYSKDDVIRKVNGTHALI